MASGTCGANLVWNLGNSILTISGTSPMENYAYYVKRAPWYQEFNNTVKRIVIEPGVMSIGDYAFRDCRLLESIVIPEGIKVVGKYAFAGCSSLTEIKLPDGVNYIGEGAFCQCESLKEMNIPDSVMNIGDRAFYNCDLKEINIPDNITTIGEDTFYGCKSLTAIKIPDKVISIGVFAFGNCFSLKEITIPDSVTSIGNHAFSNCYDLKRIYYRAGSGFESKLSEGNNAELIPVAPKNVKWRVENITLTVGGADKIKDYSQETPPWHDYLNTVQRIVIEDGVKEISANAFSNILRLEHIIIPASLKTIGDLAFKFSYCGNSEVNGGRNVFWSLDNGVLLIKKNPAAPADADFSTGYESWKAAENNIKAIKIECGVIPSKRFFEWLWQSGRDVQIKFV